MYLPSRGMRRTARRFAGLGIAATLLACGEHARVTGAPPTTVASVYTDGGGLDEQIDPSDTHVVVDISVTGMDSIVSVEPIEHPVTGVLGTAHAVAIEPDSLRVHSGFTPANASVTTSYYPLSADTSSREPDDVVRTRIVNGVATDYNIANVPVLETPEETAEGPDPLTSLPVYNALSFIDTFESKSDPGTDPDCDSDPDACGGGGGGGGPIDQGLRAAGSLQGATGGGGKSVRRRVYRPDADRVEVEVESDISAGDASAGRWARAGREQGMMTSRSHYRRVSGDRWRLERLDVQGVLVEGASRRIMRRSTRYVIRQIVRNAGRDAIRRKSIREALNRGDSVGFVRVAASGSAGATPSVVPSIVTLPRGRPWWRRGTPRTTRMDIHPRSAASCSCMAD